MKPALSELSLILFNYRSLRGPKECFSAGRDKEAVILLLAIVVVIAVFGQGECRS